MRYIETIETLKSIPGWEFVTSFSVGGFEWLAFSEKCPTKLLIISSQKATIVDVDTGTINDCNVEYDEDELIAYCDTLPDEELQIVGQYGGKLNDFSGLSGKIAVETLDNNMTSVRFISNNNSVLVYQNYGLYTCGFNYDGNVFVLVTDGGIIILRRM
ncbi:hypothetical protein [Lachnobacterium bovis]|uniref:Uncharacterized protein n=1 Tax=Lachnobacterium bovis DSM 14045 TaxID=1122142 RepID=A0A1H3MGP0_9FIRM|nr:hypothetical protein [Lachnobacterium bovis]SDY75887.1 hypothetical protein SAMN02910414_02310 [Lachnobacterium bovis DSM 14045]